MESCGCARQESVRRALAQRLGGRPPVASRPEYRIWRGMMTRCDNPNADSYPDYGGRGITVCARWRESFAAFLADLGERPSPKHSIERNDNNGNYEPANCRWATPLEQSLNRRGSSARLFLEIDGQRFDVATWARRAGVRVNLIRSRLKNGWSPKRAVLEPVGPQGRRYNRAYVQKRVTA